jgi:hypothetical protein
VPWRWNEGTESITADGGGRQAGSMQSSPAP